MFAGRAAGASIGAKGGKYTVDELYGFGKKPKKPALTVAKLGTRGQSGQGPGPKGEPGSLASQILAAAQRLMERRRLELYLREYCLSLADSVASRTAMVYRYRLWGSTSARVDNAETEPPHRVSLRLVFNMSSRQPQENIFHFHTHPLNRTVH